MLAHAHLPLTYWVEASNTAVFLINILPTTALNNLTPYQLLLNNLPDFLKVFLDAHIIHYLDHIIYFFIDPIRAFFLDIVLIIKGITTLTLPPTVYILVVMLSLIAQFPANSTVSSLSQHKENDTVLLQGTFSHKSSPVVQVSPLLPCIFSFITIYCDFIRYNHYCYNPTI